MDRYNLLAMCRNLRLKASLTATAAIDPRLPQCNKAGMAHLRSVCVYCGSSFGQDPVFARAATDLGRSLAQEGLGLVYGGGNVGLMGTVARAVIDHGGHVTGIIPEFLKARELMLPDAQELVVVPDMHTRKRLMFEKADAFVALPGGIGTLEELVEQMTWAQLGQHRKPILVANFAGFWDPLMELLDHMRRAGFVREGFEVNFLTARSIDDVIPMLRRAVESLTDEAMEGTVEDQF